MHYVWFRYLGTFDYFGYYCSFVWSKTLALIGEGLGGMITNFKSATKKNKEDQAKIEENTTVIKEDTTAIKEDATVIKEDNS